MTDFNTVLEIDEKYIKNNNIDNNLVEYLAFHIGLVELLSYWKVTCSPNLVIKCGFLNKEQIDWFKKLYFYGLGEFFYTNNIQVSQDNFVNITCLGKKIEFSNKYSGIGNIIPIGGGKDSIVSMELLRDFYDENDCFILNPKQVQISCAEIGGYKDKTIIVNKTYIDKKILELNKQGYLNGHTPFSSLLAYIAYLCAYLSQKKYIILSNESSSNESNINGQKINHQYSKSFEFERDFNNYTKKYFNIDIKYFSLLRPLNELQIAKTLSALEDYHTIFKSCNVGSKGEKWKWCCKCPKCLFVYIMLSPFLYKDKLLNIFGDNMFENQANLDTLIDLAGYGKNKPFECVGTFEEVRYALTKTIHKIENDKENMPYLLQYYKDNYPLSDLSDNLLLRYNQENNLPDELNSLLKSTLELYS